MVPVIDGVASASLLAVTAFMAHGLLAEDAPRDRVGVIAGAGLGLSIGFAVSSYVGVGRARRCERAIEVWDQSISRGR